MLINEMVRVPQAEKRLIDDNSDRTVSTDPDWQLIYNYGDITLDEQSVVVINYKYITQGMGIDDMVAHQLRFGSYRVAASRIEGSSPTELEMAVFAVLPAGTYTVAAYGHGTTNNIHGIRNLKVGVVKFLDSDFGYGDENGGTVYIPPARLTCLGKIKRYTLNVAVCAYDADSGYNTGLRTLMLDAGESPGTGEWGVRLVIEGSEVDWLERQDERMENYEYARAGATGWWSGTFEPEDSVSLSLSVQNPPTNYVCLLSYWLSPWLLPNDYEENIRLDVPQGSVIYVLTEPLEGNPTKYIGLGFRKAVNFDKDFYESASGTDILTFNASLDWIPRSGLKLLWKGFKAGVTAIAKDVRG